ncbi:MAG: chemotaxis protein CheB [Clostridia bacterium]|nr:chemotaxis protein CheB [Clostridia bacterium]
MKYEAIVIGASTGGMNALKVVLSALPKKFSVPVLVVQHLSPRSDSYLVEYLSKACKVMVKEADEKEKALPGYVYIAPPNYHLLVEKDRCLALSTEERVNYARPSVDVLFESAADAYGRSLIGIILTGANYDGSKGLRRIKQCGGLAIVQDPCSAEADAMPKAAIQAVNVDYVITLDKIAPLLNKLTEEIGE